MILILREKPQLIEGWWTMYDINLENKNRIGFLARKAD